MLKDIQVNDLVKIVGRSYILLKDKPFYLVVDKRETTWKYMFKLLTNNCETFDVSFEKKNPYGSLKVYSDV